MTTKNIIIDGYFSEDVLEILRPYYRQVLHLYSMLTFGGDLTKLANFNGTDKWGGHWYAQHYQKHFAYLRKKKLKL